MFEHPSKLLKARLDNLQDNLATENPVLIEAVDAFKRLDIVAYKLGLLSEDESFATTISWWPLVSILGTFSAGKSTFINSYIGVDLQQTGNQAVDDKFTVVTYSQHDEVRVLPGLALDADPRFPFYQISEEIEKVAEGEGSRIDSYLQLKTYKSEVLKGKILIDSPGFDADSQRNATLRITDHIIDLSDLVLVFFDARHPEPGAMKDTLEHLVSRTINRSDASKFLLILNQLDATAKEDNAEQVVAAWQRAIVQTGLSTGRFYCIYNDEAAVVIEDENLKKRYQEKRDVDLKEIEHRMSEVSVERVYRIIGDLENTANHIELKVIPALKDAMESWYKNTMLFDAIIYIILIIAAFSLSISAGYWVGWSFQPSWLEAFSNDVITQVVTAVLGVSAFVSIHFWVRSMVAKRVYKKLKSYQGSGNLAKAFMKNTRFFRSVFSIKPVGWGRGSKKVVTNVRNDADTMVKSLNDRYSDPLGRQEALNPEKPKQENLEAAEVSV
ncbi:MAG: dynamin family protein [Pseudomonadota bacterium]